MMTNPMFVALATVLIIVLSAFFVIIEFSLLGARRHRLEAEAQDSPTARAALMGVNELTVMLAGAQLGITAATFALGAVTKPAVDAWIGPALAELGIPGQVAGVASFVLSLLVVTFLHLVVGEMAPKSWAIAHPELSAKIIAIPSRLFIWPLRPLLNWINRMANVLVSASGVEPVDRAAVGGQDVETIRHLVAHSTTTGTLEESVRSPLSGLLELEELTVDSLLATDAAPTSVGFGATVGDLQDAAARTGHMRIIVNPFNGDAPEVVHIRDTLLRSREQSARDISRPALAVPTGMPVYEVLARMQEEGEQLAAVMDRDRSIGVVTISDILQRVLPMELTPPEGPTR